MLRYSVTLSHDSNGTLLVDFPDVPTAHAVGDDHRQAMKGAVEALESAIEMYIESGKPVPVPSGEIPGAPAVELSIRTASKVLSWNATLARARK